MEPPETEDITSQQKDYLLLFLPESDVPNQDTVKYLQRISPERLFAGERRVHHMVCFPGVEKSGEFMEVAFRHVLLPT